MLNLNDLYIEFLQSEAKNLCILKIKHLRESSSPAAPQNDRTAGLFSSLLEENRGGSTLIQNQNLFVFE
ncbi:MAG TPA: hypothetical protein VMX16_03140 [Terriglobia bacterium]|nr:hypothetical protein [Terriglobia bacterium]